MTRFGDGLALGPDLLSAVESAIKQATAPLGARPDLLCVFVAADDPRAVEAAVSHINDVADAGTVLGCSATGVIGGDRGVEESSAVSAWAGLLPEARIEPFRLETLRTGPDPAGEEDEGGADRLVVVGMPESRDDDVVGVLLADPFSFPVDAFVERSGEALPGLPLVGGLAGGQERGSTRLFVGGEVFESGAVGVVIGGPVTAATVVSQGARPIGPTMVVTRADDNVLYELAGMPALDKLEEIVLTLPDDEQELASRGLLIGVAMDEYADQHEQGDFLVRGVVGADTDSGAIAIGDVVEVGRTVRFQVRDAGAADEDLAQLLDRFDLTPVEGALLFSCNGRGRAMFPNSDHDVRMLRRGFGAARSAGRPATGEPAAGKGAASQGAASRSGAGGAAGGAAIGGFFASGEIGPVAGRNHVHGFTASILAFGSPPRSSVK